MSEKIIVNGNEFEVLKPQGEFKLISVEDHAIHYQTPMGRKTANFFQNRKSGETYLSIEGKTYCVNDNRQRKSKRAGGKSDPLSIVAPMPGKVFKHLKAVGETVIDNETVSILEAMKMEHPLKAVKQLKISKINFNEGEQVKTGDVIVELEEISQ
ncbi:MAG: biotin/lipoyl-binding protein [Halobacteriovoraceae bacterium]|nr:biotin/lipoyl-binding protein [Halobacteriovoraceae bacterium]MCB9093851.1 biotin/lipoyl-binding protein [Halobacteriovoraceae bacterium]